MEDRSALVMPLTWEPNAPAPCRPTVGATHHEWSVCEMAGRFQVRRAERQIWTAVSLTAAVLVRLSVSKSLDHWGEGLDVAHAEV
jgi:hypothetical protein